MIALFGRRPRRPLETAHDPANPQTPSWPGAGRRTASTSKLKPPSAESAFLSAAFSGDGPASTSPCTRALGGSRLACRQLERPRRGCPGLEPGARDRRFRHRRFRAAQSSMPLSNDASQHRVVSRSANRICSTRASGRSSATSATGLRALSAHP